jgi:hypothetical protein
MGRKHDSKIDPSPIVRGHLATLVGADGHPRTRDYVEQAGVPVAVGIGAGLGNAVISTTTGTAVLTLAGLFAAFLFQLTIQLLDRAADWAESSPLPSPATSRYADLLGELSANTGYAALVAGLTASVGLVAGLLPSGLIERLTAALLVCLLAHLGVTLLLVANRTYLLTRAYLNAARTGESLKKD